MGEAGIQGKYESAAGGVPVAEYDVVRKRIEELGARIKHSRQDVDVVKRLGSIQQQCWTLEALTADARDKYENDVKRWLATRRTVGEDVVRMRGLIDRERTNAQNLERKKCGLLERKGELLKKLERLDELKGRVNEMDASRVEASEAISNKKRRLEQLDSTRRDLKREVSEKSALADKLRRRYRLRSYEVDNIEERLAELVQENLRRRVDVGKAEEKLWTGRTKWEQRVDGMERLERADQGVASRMDTSQTNETKHQQCKDGYHHVRFDANLLKQNGGGFGAFGEGSYERSTLATDWSESVEGESSPPTNTTLGVMKTTSIDSRLLRLQDDDELSIIGGG
ncbi:hypothetical protein BSKO_07082 [Bryopsis sp. KO-2023]|nr:hypothetical protein BSKO_07082 [Bryopsis sp. KO-2023]